MLHRGLHVWSLKPYCVTVMDNWTTMRLFWTVRGAIRFRDKHKGYAYVYKWIKGYGWHQWPVGF